jgi:manganese transport protein
VMKTHVFGFFTNAVLALIFAFALVMSYMSINGIIATVQSV